MDWKITTTLITSILALIGTIISSVLSYKSKFLTKEVIILRNNFKKIKKTAKYHLKYKPICLTHYEQKCDFELKKKDRNNYYFHYNNSSSIDADDYNTKSKELRKQGIKKYKCEIQTHIGLSNETNKVIKQIKINDKLLIESLRSDSSETKIIINTVNESCKEMNYIVDYYIGKYHFYQIINNGIISDKKKKINF